MPISFCLVNPEDPRNVGAAARATKNMAINEMRIVGGQGIHLAKEARFVAHNAQDQLDRIQFFSSLESAVADADVVIGTTVRHRKIRAKYLPPDELKSHLIEQGSLDGRVMVLFGNEVTGLLNEELALCHLISSVPTAVAQPSLNLAQAVMIYAYELCTLNKTLIDERVARAATSLPTVKRTSEDLMADLQQLGVNLSDRDQAQIRLWIGRLCYEDLQLVQGLRRRLRAVQTTN